MEASEELVRLQVMLLKRQAPSQSALVLELHGAGFSTSRIAELLGTTSNTVNVTIQKAKKKDTKSA